MGKPGMVRTSGAIKPPYIVPFQSSVFHASKHAFFYWRDGKVVSCLFTTACEHGGYVAHRGGIRTFERLGDVPDDLRPCQSCFRGKSAVWRIWEEP